MINYKEIFKLKDMLTNANIDHIFYNRSESGGYQICYPDNGVDRICSVILHNYSYGNEKGLLEIMGLLTDDEYEQDTVKGYLTAEEVFKRIKEDWDNRKENI